MPACKHESLEYLGEQKTDDGVNTYSRCKDCGSLVVLTPSRTVFSVKGVKRGQPKTAPSKKKGN
jgi:hypothetical protein